MRKFLVSALLLTLVSFTYFETRQQLLYEQLELFGDFFTELDKNYVDTVDIQNLMKATMKKTVAELDSYSGYYDKIENDKRNNDWKGILFAGIGSSINPSDSGATIAYPYTDMPAMKAGLRTGDLILEINNKNVQHIVFDSIIKQLKGNEGDSLQLMIQRPNVNQKLNFIMVRKTIVQNTVPLYFMENDSTGYIQLSQFLRGTSIQFKKIFSELKSSGMQRLILDLRGNIGGLVDECTSTVSTFLPLNTLVCSLKMKDSTQNYAYRTTEVPIDTIMPIIALIDKKTISSGEIFSGCLQDHHRAILAGETTFGKGLVQTTHILKNRSCLYITSAHYYTPSGKYIGKKGVDPDIKCNTKDSIPNLVQAIIQSQIIVHYCIQYRSLQSEKYPTDKNSFYSSFNSFYASKLKSIHLPEEDYLPKLSAYNATENLKKEITSYKKQLPLRFKNEIQIELKKELLKQNYQYTEAGKLNFEHSAVYSFLEKKGWVNSKVKFK
jgi:C-terminal peptidase prc